MKINQIKYNTFIICLYINSLFISSLFEIFKIQIPAILIIFILSLFTKYNKIKFDKIYFIYLCFGLYLFLNLILKIQDKRLLIVYFKFLIILFISFRFTYLNISLKYLNIYLKYFNILYIIFLLYLIKNQFLYYSLKLNYMSWGYECLIPTLIFSYLYNRNKEYKYLFLTSLSIIALFLFGSRFSFLLGITGVFLFVYFIFNKFFKYLCWISGIIFLLIFQNLDIILKNIIDILNKYHVPSFSVVRLYNSFLGLNTDGKGILSGRELWYSEALKLIKEYPLFGSGILGYVNKIPIKLYNGNGTFYPHNIFLEILMHFGIVGLIIFFIIIFLVIRKIYIKRKNGYKIDNIYFVFVILSLKLLLSSSYLFERWFWFVLLIPFNKSYYNKISKTSNKTIDF